MHRIRLLESKPLTRRVWHLAFEAPFRHEAGQHVALQATVDGEALTGYFSIASPPGRDGRIEFCLDVAGRLGRHIRDLRPGDTVACGEPSGTMRLLEAATPSVYFASGTGVAPLRAILLSQLAADLAAEAVLVQGARRSADLHFRREFEGLASSHPGFRFLPTVTRSEDGWTGRTGRVAEHVEEAVAGRSGLVAYICGQPEMVAGMRRRLAAAGIADERQCFERY